MVIAPHRALAVRDLLAWTNGIPAIGPVIYRVEYEALVAPGVCREIRFVEQGIGYGQAGLAVAGAVAGVVFGQKVVSQADQAWAAIAAAELSTGSQGLNGSEARSR